MQQQVETLEDIKGYLYRLEHDDSCYTTAKTSRFKTHAGEQVPCTPEAPAIGLQLNPQQNTDECHTRTATLHSSLSCPDSSTSMSQSYKRRRLISVEAGEPRYSVTQETGNCESATDGREVKSPAEHILYPDCGDIDKEQRSSPIQYSVSDVNLCQKKPSLTSHIQKLERRTLIFNVDDTTAEQLNRV